MWFESKKNEQNHGNKVKNLLMGIWIKSRCMIQVKQCVIQITLGLNAFDLNHQSCDSSQEALWLES